MYWRGKVHCVAPGFDFGFASAGGFAMEDAVEFTQSDPP
jgi:hypothetical protein